MSQKYQRVYRKDYILKPFKCDKKFNRYFRTVVCYRIRNGAVYELTMSYISTLDIKSPYWKKQYERSIERLFKYLDHTK